MSDAGDNIVFKEPRLLPVLFLAFSVGVAILACLGLSGGAKYGVLATVVLFAIWPVSRILRPRRFAEIRDSRFEIVNAETWKTDVFSIHQLRRVFLEPVVLRDKGGPEGGPNFQHRLTLHSRDGRSACYLLPYRDSICKGVARELKARMAAAPVPAVAPKAVT